MALETDTIVRLYDDVSNIYAIKEASGSISKIVELQSRREELVILSGEDPIDHPILASGGKGIISVTSNILPNLKSKLVHAALDGDFKTSKKINEELLPLNTALFCESNPIPIKAAMYIAGLIDSLEYRLPLTKPSAENMKLIENAIKNYEVIK